MGIFLHEIIACKAWVVACQENGFGRYLMLLTGDCEN